MLVYISSRYLVHTSCPVCMLQNFLVACFVMARGSLSILFPLCCSLVACLFPNCDLYHCPYQFHDAINTEKNAASHFKLAHQANHISTPSKVSGDVVDTFSVSEDRIYNLISPGRLNLEAADILWSANLFGSNHHDKKRMQASIPTSPISQTVRYTVRR